jgi:flagellar FliJ protein
MSKNLPIETLIELAEKEVEDAKSKLATLQQQRAEGQQQLDALGHYRDEYRARMNASAQDGIRASSWRNFQTFIETLDTAIAQQHQALAAADVRIDACKADMLVKRQKLVAYETMVKRVRQKESATLAKIEQRQSDEFAAKIARTRAEQAQG